MSEFFITSNSTSTTAVPSGPLGPGGPVGPGGPSDGGDDGGTGTGGTTPTTTNIPYKLIAEWIDNYNYHGLNGLGTNYKQEPWQFDFNCKFFVKKYTISDNGSSTFPNRINKIKLALYEVIKNNNNYTTITHNNISYSNKDYPALKEVGKKLPPNHPLNSLDINVGTHKEVCTWLIDVNPYDVNPTSYTLTGGNKTYYINSYRFTIDYKLNLKKNWPTNPGEFTDYTPNTQLSTNYTQDITLDLNKHYFVKVLPAVDEEVNEKTQYITLNSNDLLNREGKLYESGYQSTFRGQNFEWYNNYRAGESLLNISSDSPGATIKKKNIYSSYSNLNEEPITPYNYINKPYIIKNTIDGGDYAKKEDPFESYLNFLSTTNDVGAKSYGTPWTIIYDANGVATDSATNVKTPWTISDIHSYFSRLAWFKTPAVVWQPPQYPELKKNDIETWIYPNPSDQGYWYQLYDSWNYDSNSKLIFLREGVNDAYSPNGYNTNGLGGYYPYNYEKYQGENISYPIHYYFNHTFEKDYNYQFVIYIKNFAKKLDFNLKLTTPWMDKILLKIDNNTLSNKNNYTINYNVYSNINAFKLIKETNIALYNAGLTNEYDIKLPDKKPISKVKSTTNPQNPITISANTNFSINNGVGIEKIILYKNKWFIQGYAAYSDYSNQYLNSNGNNSNGWHYNAVESVFTYLHDKNAVTDYPFGGNVNDYFSEKKQDSKYIEENFISRYIKVQSFNLSFDYTNGTDMYITIYSGTQLPSDKTELKNLIEAGSVSIISEVKKSKTNPNSSDGTKQNCEFIGLDGNQYIFIIVYNMKAITNKASLIIENLKIEGEYHQLNNTLFKNLDNLYKDNINNIQTSYSIKLGKGNNLNDNSVNDIYIINSKIGNSNFQSGIWENGVWQSGWRDSKQYAFIDVDQFFSYDNNRIWRFIISGNIEISSNYDLNIGDKISISNIVAIDINGDRRLIKNYFTISEIFGKSIVVEFIYDFPINSIQKDSENHLIMVTKSIWLYGIFLNGRFKGNWIDGIVKGYPFITKIEESHWIDGDFSGGHFKSNVIKYTIDKLDKDKDPVYYVIKTKEDNQLQNGDIFYLPNENREFKVLSIIDSKSFYSDIRKDDNVSINIYTVISTSKKSGLIQNMNFNSDNTSDKTISKSFISEYIFSYNSWLDLVYDNSSATNIFKSQNIPDNVGGFYSENNLYGYITNDVLSSFSKFRDSYSTNVREYRLGTKWKIFYDYIGESSTFDEYFHSVYTPKKTLEMGWSFNISKNELPNISRFIGYRTDDKNEDITGKELKLVAEGDGGILNLDNRSINNIPFRYTEKIKPNGYSFISFDLISKEIYGLNYQKGKDLSIVNSEQITWYNATYSIVDSISQFEPIFSFSNINQTNIVRNGKTLHKKMTYLPIYQNINHLETSNKTKIEYFFNKRDLMLSLKGSGYYGLGTASIVIDNLKFYETDMIPFFQYFTIENINKGVQIPNGIDYVKFDYNTSINYNYVSYTSNKTYNYFDVDRFKSDTLINDSFWLKDNSLNSININDFFNRSI